MKIVEKFNIFLYVGYAYFAGWVIDESIQPIQDESAHTQNHHEAIRNHNNKNNNSKNEWE